MDFQQRYGLRKSLEPLYPADYKGVGVKEKSAKILKDTRKRINEGLGELIKAHGNQKTDTNFPRINSAEGE